MSCRTASSCSIENGQPSSSNSNKLRLAKIGRDYNVNSGSGAFIVNNDNRILQQARPIRWHIRGSQEEEAEYDQYGEYRRSDVRLLQMIHHKRVKLYWDREAGLYTPVNCEQSVWLGEVTRGDGKGTIVTVVSYQGKDAPEV
ncbi:hypothetical protein PQX77_021188 [Marasmius sp. AFHP31]|nr:hypothetical protein PQX77_021188 [Marasmius sp. AFHP31]